MSKWSSAPKGEPSPVPDGSARERYVAQQWQNYDDEEFADLGLLFSEHGSALANDSSVVYSIDSLPELRLGEVVDAEPDEPNGDRKQPPGELGRRALGMSTRDILDHYYY